MNRATGAITVISVGSDRPVIEEEDHQGLALGGDEVELAQRLRHPDRAGEADEAGEEGRRARSGRCSARSASWVLVDRRLADRPAASPGEASAPPVSTRPAPRPSTPIGARRFGRFHGRPVALRSVPQQVHRSAGRGTSNAVPLRTSCTHHFERMVRSSPILGKLASWRTESRSRSGPSARWARATSSCSSATTSPWLRPWPRRSAAAWPIWWRARPPASASRASPCRPWRCPRPPASTRDRLVVIGLGSEKDRAKIDWPALGGFTASKVSGRERPGRADPRRARRHRRRTPPTSPSAPACATTASTATRPRRSPRARRPRATALTLMVADAGRRRGRREGRRGGRRRRHPRPRPRQRAAERALPGGVRPPRRGADASSASRSRCSAPASSRRSACGALLAVAQGSTKEARVVVMRWNGGADAAEAPLAFIGKGVCFDSGGISIKSAGGMEDMKGDMGGAACVVGLMHALASPQGEGQRRRRHRPRREHARRQRQRPGDIVTSMSGQTIEIINTDAEGRLVLADVLWHVQERLQAEVHDRPRDPDRRDHRRARPGHRRAVLQRRRARRPSSPRPARRRARPCGGCRWARPTTRRSTRSSPT